MATNPICFAASMYGGSLPVVQSAGHLPYDASVGLVGQLDAAGTAPEHYSSQQSNAPIGVLNGDKAVPLPTPRSPSKAHPKLSCGISSE